MKPLPRNIALIMQVGWLLISPPVAAQIPNCIDQTRSAENTDQCGGSLLTTIDAEFKRLGEKFEGNETMQEMLRDMKKSWIKSRALQCTFEAMAASGKGDEVFKPFSIEANRAYAKCSSRTLNEMLHDLKKY